MLFHVNIVNSDLVCKILDTMNIKCQILFQNSVNTRTSKPYMSKVKPTLYIFYSLFRYTGNM